MRAEELKEVYLQAAESLAIGESIFSCVAVAYMEGFDQGPALKFYQAIMKPDDCSELDWAGRIGLWTDEKAVNIRVLLLCLMAASVEDFYAE